MALRARCKFAVFSGNCLFQNARIRTISRSVHIRRICKPVALKRIFGASKSCKTRKFNGLLNQANHEEKIAPKRDNLACLACSSTINRISKEG
ncbi:MAG: hypothetical protein WA681_01075, partial [Candidatus Acidiferrales bacterium]